MIRTVHPIGVLVPEPAPPWLPPSGVRQRISGPRREAPGDAGPEPGGSGRSPPRALSVVLNRPPRAGAGPALQGNVWQAAAKGLLGAVLGRSGPLARTAPWAAVSGSLQNGRCWGVSSWSLEATPSSWEGGRSSRLQILVLLKAAPLKQVCCV